jgi:pimeloyl-ACP methyl ester carboxylesterase
LDFRFEDLNATISEYLAYFLEYSSLKTIPLITMATKPIIVIVYGGWHVPENFDDLKVILQAAGYEVHVPRLPSSNGSRPPNADLSDDTKLVRSLVKELLENGCNVVALMHSYGGQVGSNALHGLSSESRSAQGLKGGVSHLIYLSAFAVPEGTSMRDKAKDFASADSLPKHIDMAEDGSCMNLDAKTRLIGPGRDGTESEAYIKSLMRWNGNCAYPGGKSRLPISTQLKI